MNLPPEPLPPKPRKTPFGTVRLAAPLSAPAAPRRAGPPAGGQWVERRVEMPLLSFEGLRARDVTCEG